MPHNRNLRRERLEVTGMSRFRSSPFCLRLLCACPLVFLSFFLASMAHAEKLSWPPEVSEILNKIYSFDLAGGVAAAERLEEKEPSQPLGYLLEAEALWWRMWCTSADFKYGMTYTWRRSRIPTDEHYLALVAKASALAQARLKDSADPSQSAQMQLYAGLADAFAARLYGWRGEARATARSGVRAREHFLRAERLDSDLSDAEFGLGLYNYYADTLSGLAKFLRFFAGIPGGNKQEGIRQLDDDMAKGVLTPDAARFYLAVSLHRFDQQYDEALRIIAPLADKYPSNPLFQLVRGDLNAKLGRKQEAWACYRAAASAPVDDPECRSHLQQLVRSSLAAGGFPSAPSDQSRAPRN
jgi:tetratricopeptide (TPR) repeat protein